MPFESDRPGRVAKYINAAEAREKIKAALIEAFTVEELGTVFDNIPDDPRHNPAHDTIISAVAEAWADHPDRTP